MDHDETDLDLSTRLAALESRAPGTSGPPALPPSRRRGRIAISIAMNPGQPLAGAHMECMTPLEAADFLAVHGFSNVVWQVEGGDPDAKGVDGQAATTSVQQSFPPEHGFVIPGSLLKDGSVIMVVDQRVGATGVGDCSGQPMP